MLHLTDKELIDLGIGPIGPRRDIQRSIAALGTYANPFDTLPDAMLTYVFSFLEPWQFDRSVRLVCRRWHRCTPRWTELHYCRLPDKVYYRSANLVAIPTRFSSLTSLVVGRPTLIYDLADVDLSSWSRLAPTLTNLNLSNCRLHPSALYTLRNLTRLTHLNLDFTENFQNRELYRGALVEISQLPLLTHLSLAGVVVPASTLESFTTSLPCLSSLTIGWKRSLSPSEVALISASLSRFPALTHLAICRDVGEYYSQAVPSVLASSLSSLTSLTRLDIPAIGLLSNLSFLSSLPLLTSLALSLDSSSLLSPPQPLPPLTRLSVLIEGPITTTTAAFISSFPLLTSLGLGGSYRPTPLLPPLLCKLDNLSSLTLLKPLMDLVDSDENATDSDLTSALPRLPALRSLTLALSSAVPSEVTAALASLRNLSRLRLVVPDDRRFVLDHADDCRILRSALAHTHFIISTDPDDF